jgi:hypothetical protein
LIAPDRDSPFAMVASGSFRLAISFPLGFAAL